MDTKLLQELADAETNYHAEKSNAVTARAAETAACNRLNEAQKAIDKALADKIKAAPFGSEWGGRDSRRRECEVR